MSIADIRATRVSDIAHKDCILWLWTTNHHVREAFDLLDAWDRAAERTPHGTPIALEPRDFAD